MDQISILTLIACAILGVGGLSILAGLMRRISAQKLEIISFESEIKLLKSEITSLKTEREQKLNDYEVRIKALRDVIDNLTPEFGANSREKLLKYLGTLKNEISAQISALTHSLDRGSTTAFLAKQEMEHTRLVDRKMRFASYEADLVEAGVNIDDYRVKLEGDLKLVEAFVSSLKSYRLDASMGSLEIKAIDTTIGKMNDEAHRAFMEEIRLGIRDREIAHARAFRDKMLEVDKRLKEAELPNPKQAGAMASPDTD